MSQPPTQPSNNSEDSNTAPDAIDIWAIRNGDKPPVHVCQCKVSMVGYPLAAICPMCGGEMKAISIFLKVQGIEPFNAKP